MGLCSTQSFRDPESFYPRGPLPSRAGHPPGRGGKDRLKREGDLGGF